MKWLLYLIGLFFVGCSSVLEPESDCGECGLNVYAVNLIEAVSYTHLTLPTKRIV